MTNAPRSSRSCRKALAGPVTDMTGVGLTARWVAANRALETDHASPLYRDPLARELAGEAGFDVLYSMRTAAGMGTFNGPDPFLTFARASSMMPCSTRPDRRSIRSSSSPPAWTRAHSVWSGRPVVRVFEVDRDDVFAHKEAGARAHEGEARVRPRVVRQDLAQPWASALVDAGFDPTRKAAFLAEGLLYYLDEAAVTSLFEALRGIAAPGSWLGVDAMNPEVLTSPFMATYLKRLTAAWLSMEVRCRRS